jgi:D-alanine-D-alanine ligase
MTYLPHSRLARLEEVDSESQDPELKNEIQWLSRIEQITNSYNNDNNIDVFFPIIHGTNGEDGTLQGFFEILGLPYVGAGVLGSAIGMDKDVMKRLLQQANIPVARYLTIQSNDWLNQRNTSVDGKVEHFIETVNYPVFVKPANMGSSIGISKVRNDKELFPALDTAFTFDSKVIIEEFIDGYEIEVSVLGNEDPRASLPGRVIPNHEFYTYEDKYFDNGAHFEIPAKLSEAVIQQIQATAVEVFKRLECSGFARVDFFLRPNGELIVNEINTLPGFTKTSVYPKLWEVSGVPYSELLDTLIELAIKRHTNKS